MDSMPPATMMSLVPAASRSCASIAAFIPEPHILLMVVQPVARVRPAPSDAWRAGAWPKPAGSTQPMMTSSTCSGLILARSTAARIAAAPSSVAANCFSSPWNAPRGVRAAETITIGSFMAVPFKYQTRLLQMPLDQDFALLCRTALPGFAEQFPADEHSADFRSAGADLVQLCVAPQTTGRGLVDIAHAAQGLDRLARHPGGFLGSVEDGAGGVLARAGSLEVAAVQCLAHGVDVGAAGVHGGVHVGELALHQLEFADGLAELLAFVHIWNDHVHARGHDAQRSAGEHCTLVIEAAHQHIHSVAHAADYVVLRHFALAEHQFTGVGAAHAELVQLLRGGEARKALLYQKGGDAARSGAGVGLGVDHQHVGIRAVGDPHFVAVEDEFPALVLGLETHADHVRPGAGLGHCQRADILAGQQAGQVFLLLRCVAVAVDLVHAQVGVGAVGQADRRPCAADFLHRDDVREIAHAGAAVFFADGDAEQADGAELAPQVGGELVCAVDLGGAWRNLARGKIAHRVAQHVDVYAEVEWQGRNVEHRFTHPALKLFQNERIRWERKGPILPWPLMLL